MSQIDLTAPPTGHNYTVSVKPDETRGDAVVRHIREVVVIAIAVGLVCAVGYICVVTVLSETVTPQEKTWAQSTLLGATGGVLGYLLRRP